MGRRVSALRMAALPFLADETVKRPDTLVGVSYKECSQKRIRKNQKVRAELLYSLSLRLAVVSRHMARREGNFGFPLTVACPQELRHSWRIGQTKTAPRSDPAAIDHGSLSKSSRRLDGIIKQEMRSTQRCGGVCYPCNCECQGPGSFRWFLRSESLHAMNKGCATNELRAKIISISSACPKGHYAIDCPFRMLRALSHGSQMSTLMQMDFGAMLKLFDYSSTCVCPVDPRKSSRPSQQGPE